MTEKQSHPNPDDAGKASAGNGLESQPVTDSEIRRVFLEHGFTVKDGQPDLKPYVLEAGRALVALAQAAPQPQAEAVTVDALAELMANAECTPDETAWRYMGEIERNSWRAAARVAMAHRLDGGQQQAEAVAQPGNPLAKHGYTMSESGDSGYRLVVGFETLSDLQAAHKFVARAAQAMTAGEWAEHVAQKLFEAIAHGDDAHRAWLRDALDAFFAGRYVPAVAPQPAPQERLTWQQALEVSEMPEVDEAIRALLDDHTEDNAVWMVQAIAKATATGSGEAV